MLHSVRDAAAARPIELLGSQVISRTVFDKPRSTPRQDKPN